MTNKRPNYQENILLYRNLSPILALSSRVSDLHRSIISENEYCNLQKWLMGVYGQDPTATVVFFSPYRGFYNDQNQAQIRRFLSWVSGGKPGITFAEAVCTIADIAKNHPEAAFTLIMEDASRLCCNPSLLSESEKDSYGRLKEIFSALNSMSRRLVLLLDKKTDLPAFFRDDRVSVRSIELPLPDTAERKSFLTSLLRKKNYSDREYQSLAEAAGGMYLIETARVLDAIGSDNPNATVHELTEQLKLARYGVKENPWQQLTREKLDDIARMLKKKIFGQDRAIDLLMHNIVNAKYDCSLSRTGSTKPKGVMTFGGPTGCGKTWTAQLSALGIFGSTDNLIRIDMNEYADSMSKTKFTSAAPGYIGYGDRTALIDPLRDNPFRIILLDEVEKAHADVLDVILNMIDCGRLSDSTGDTVSLENCIIIFTTNLGADRIIAGEAPIKAVKDAMIRNMRPEMYGRLASGIVAFDPLGKPEAEAIFHSEMDDLLEAYRQDKKLEIVFTEEVLTQLKDQVVATLSIQTGGRGIVDAFKYRVRTALSAFLAGNGIENPGRITIKSITETEISNVLHGEYSAAAIADRSRSARQLPAETRETTHPQKPAGNSRIVLQ